MSGFFIFAPPPRKSEDITYRVVRVLGEADLIAAEDTRTLCGCCAITVLPLP